MLGLLSEGLHAASLFAGDAKIISGVSGAPVTYQALLAQLKLADVVLLGEIHENPLHHQVRARVLADLARKELSVVAEHLQYGRKAEFTAGLLAGLERAGFDAKAWEWPMHEPLFEAARNSGLKLLGGNLSAAQSAALSRKGESVLPQELRVLINKAPLPSEIEIQLDEALFEGHCKMIPQSLIPQMRLVQRGRDAAMAQAAMSHLPALMLVGNGHAWKQAGIAQLIAAAAPNLKVISLIFSEGEPSDLHRADYFWITPVVDRPDPCDRLRPKQN